MDTRGQRFKEFMETRIKHLKDAIKNSSTPHVKEMFKHKLREVEFIMESIL